MQLVSPLPGGTVENARAQLVVAQGHAAALSNAPGTDTARHLADGIAAARLAASELFLAQPRSDYQDLVAARQHVIEGQQALAKANDRVLRWKSVDPPLPLVKDLAFKAFLAFEGAFEILDND